ncbi:MAG TPA: DUF6438 domain-containing protein [Chitinophaga sp.]|uniref:DUF6438 domain-containing protein n=1 Tax=Chitinophaga sp. TaxID=1869181 RepID=UPI002C814B1A|nr:DUF6438 domain-containing protein [Chitinophaga sp.]HVI47049.1 DUF6438 domain-containing protein [Chitinophaga sp.]
MQTLEEIQAFVTELNGHANEGVISFFKTDMDGDGFTDLIINGVDRLMAVMDRGRTGYKLYRIDPSDYISKYLLQKIDSTGRQKLLLLKTTTKQSVLNNRKRLPKVDEDTSLHKLPPIDYYAYKEAQRIDTLVYKFNGFIEYNAAPSPSRLKSIRLARTSCLGTCPVYNLTINSDRSADYNAGYYTGKSGHFTGLIRETEFNELMQLIDYIHVQSLDVNYDIDATDHATAHLTIIFEDGQEKSIRDYGMSGTHGLGLLYSFIDVLRNSQKWVWDRKIR